MATPSLYLLCYDIMDEKRLYRVRKRAYPLALGGQKSALETHMTPSDARRALAHLAKFIDDDIDRLHIIPVASHPRNLGAAFEITFDQGAIIL